MQPFQRTPSPQITPKSHSETWHSHARQASMDRSSQDRANVSYPKCLSFFDAAKGDQKPRSYSEETDSSSLCEKDISIHYPSPKEDATSSMELRIGGLSEHMFQPKEHQEHQGNSYSIDMMDDGSFAESFHASTVEESHPVMNKVRSFTGESDLTTLCSSSWTRSNTITSETITPNSLETTPTKDILPIRQGSVSPLHLANHNKKRRLPTMLRCNESMDSDCASSLHSSAESELALYLGQHAAEEAVETSGCDSNGRCLIPFDLKRPRSDSLELSSVGAEDQQEFQNISQDHQYLPDPRYNSPLGMSFDCFKEPAKLFIQTPENNYHGTLQSPIAVAGLNSDDRNGFRWPVSRSSTPEIPRPFFLS